MSSYKTSVDRVINELYRDISDMSGIIVAEFSKEASLEIGEEWAWKVIDLLLDDRMQGLKQTTVKTRQGRGISIAGDSKVLIETGTLLSSIEVTYKHTSGTSADILELGVKDSIIHAHHGTEGALSAQQLMRLHEYGFTVKGNSVPARPILKQAALEIGYETDRILSDEWNHFIRGRTVQKFIKGDSVVSRGARSGAKSSHTTDVGFTATGRIKQNGTSSEFYFEWDSTGKKYKRGNR